MKPWWKVRRQQHSTQHPGAWKPDNSHTSLMASWTAESVQEYSLVAYYSYLSSVSLNPPVTAVCSGVPTGEQALAWGLDYQTDHEKPWTRHKQLWTLQIQSEKLKVVTVSNAWTSRVDKGELHSNFTNNWKGIVGTLLRVEACRASSITVTISITTLKLKVT